MKHIAHFFIVLQMLLLGGVFIVAPAHADEEIPAVPSPATIIATKIVCQNEANLPNFGLGGPDITDETVNDFLTVHPNCHREAGWVFQYDTMLASNPGDNLIGEASAPWVTTAPTDANGETTFTIPESAGEVHVREVMQPGYIGFTHGDVPENTEGYTAELYCGNDVINYDNFDFVRAPQSGVTYHCVAWNAPVRTYPAYCGDGIVNQSWEACDGDAACTDQCQLSAEQCTENVFAHVVVTDTENIGYGDASDVMYVGGTAQPDWAWFPVKMNGTTLIDPSIDSYQDVPGLAVERSLAGIRVRLFGSHDDGSQEHSEGYVEFSSGTTIGAQTLDMGVNAPENAKDNVKAIAAGQDEVWIEGNKSHYWFTVTSKNDGYTTSYTGPMCENSQGSQDTTGTGDDTKSYRGSGGATPPACADGSDNDNDGKADYPADPGCTSSLDNDESDGVTGGGVSSSTGSVLGASTTEPTLPSQCKAYVNGFMRLGKKNDVEDVKRLQGFLNETIGTNLPETGYFGKATQDAVKKFQKKYHAEILKPWLDAGWSGKDLENGTGYVYKTTKRWVNLMKCESLVIPMPELK